MNKKKIATANYSRGILTIDLPNAKEPVLWRQEIKEVSRISFALQPLADGERALVLHANEGAEQVIASFTHPAAAEEALAVLRDVLLNAGSEARQFIQSIWRAVKWLLIIVAIIAALRIAYNIFINYVAMQAMQQVTQGTQMQSPQKKTPPYGVPLSADEYLEAPAE